MGSGIQTHGSQPIQQCMFMEDPEACSTSITCCQNAGHCKQVKGCRCGAPAASKEAAGSRHRFSQSAIQSGKSCGDTTELNSSLYVMLTTRHIKPHLWLRNPVMTCRPLGSEERVLMWRFRFSLTSDRRALTKFLKCVDWSDASEARQAAELMQQWAPIEIADALELLSPDFSNQEVCHSFLNLATSSRP